MVKAEAITGVAFNGSGSQFSLLEGETDMDHHTTSHSGAVYEGSWSHQEMMFKAPKAPKALRAQEALRASGPYREAVVGAKAR